jgi:CDP-glucose 4,6-dehydratase
MITNNILVTGASGFTGSWLADHLLNEGAFVATILADADPDGNFIRNGLTRRVKCVEGSILDFDLIARTIADLNIDTVFHLAAVSVEHKAFDGPRACFDVNIRGTYHLLEACRLNAMRVERVIVASSDKVYGDNPDLPYRETMSVQGMNPYDVSKSCVDLLARSYHHSYGLPVAVARFANVYGGGDLNWSRLVPNTIRRLLQGDPPVVRSPAPNVFKRDFLYIKDQVRAYMALFKGMSRAGVCGQAFNFGMGLCLSVPDVVRRIQQLMGVEQIVPIFEPCERGEILHQQLLSDRAKKELDWTPVCSLDDGLAETIEWYAQFLSGPLHASKAKVGQS